jgi:hypothetical protein
MIPILATIGAATVVIVAYELAPWWPTICQVVRSNSQAQVVIRHLCNDHHRRNIIHAVR